MDLVPILGRLAPAELLSVAVRNHSLGGLNSSYANPVSGWLLVVLLTFCEPSTLCSLVNRTANIVDYYLKHRSIFSLTHHTDEWLSSRFAD